MSQSRCSGCGVVLADSDTPTHPYMLSSPACWALYAELGARIMTAGTNMVGARHHVDCYAVQHPDGAEYDRRQRQSVAVHLTSLCLLVEFGQPPSQASARRGRMSQRVLPALGLADWPYLPPPLERGAMTAADVHEAKHPEDFDNRLQEWTHSAWFAWNAHHDTVRVWAATAWESRV